MQNEQFARYLDAIEVDKNNPLSFKNGTTEQQKLGNFITKTMGNFKGNLIIFNWAY